MPSTLVQDDVLHWAETYDGPPFHAMLCDPPYELNFMSRNWDRTGIAFRPETWKALAQHLLPGAFGMAFASARGWHRLACAIEDAGLILHPSIFGWGFGCLSEDTEILTAQGWSSYHNLMVGSMVACYNVQHGTIEWQPVQEIQEYDYADTAYRICSDSTDQLVSRNHRCLVERGGRYVFRYAEALEREEAVPFLASMSDVLAALQRGTCRRISQSPSLLAGVCESYLCDEAPQATRSVSASHESWAALQTERTNYYVSGLWNTGLQTLGLAAKSQYPDVFQEVQWDVAWRGMGKTWAQRTGSLDRRDRRKLSSQEAWPKQPCLEGWGNVLSQARQLSFSQVCPVSPRIYSDGPQGWLCHGTSPPRSTNHWPTFVTQGSGPSRQSRSTRQFLEESPPVCEQYGSQALRTSWVPPSTLATITPVSYHGKVWCVRVPTGAFVARRNGHIFMTGNSGFPKATRIDVDRVEDYKLKAEVRRAAVCAVESAGLKLPSNSRWDWTVGEHAPGDKWWAEFLQWLPNLSDTDREHVEGAIVATIRKTAGWFTTKDMYEIRRPALPRTQTWEGHRYGLQALKPALEPLIVFQKPYQGSPVESITQTGAGALWIEGGRIATGDSWDDSGCLHGGNSRNAYGNGLNNAGRSGSHSAGRWPPNLALCHTPQCERVGTREVLSSHDGRVPGGGDTRSLSYGLGTHSYSAYASPEGTETVPAWRCAAGCPVDAFDRQAGERKAGGAKDCRGQEHGFKGSRVSTRNQTYESYADTGPASRFFHVSDWSLDVAEQLARADPVRYEAKASRRERSAGLEGMLASEGMMQLRHDLTQEQREYVMRELRTAGVVPSP